MKLEMPTSVQLAVSLSYFDKYNTVYTICSHKIYLKNLIVQLKGYKYNLLLVIGLFHLGNSSNLAIMSFITSSNA